MDKILYWIDDDISNILDLSKKTFPILWGLDQEDHIINKVIAFGDDLEKGLDSGVLNDRRERNIIHRLTSYFKEECDSVGQANPVHELFEKNKYMTDEIFRLFAKKTTESSCDADKKRQALTDRIIEFWKDTEMLSNDEEYQNNKSDIDKLITEFAIPDDAFVAIDLVLLYKDDERVKMGNRILSMELYEKLSSKKPERCFIYSRYISDIQLAEKWREIYHQYYRKDAQIKLYKRKDFSTDEPNGMQVVKKIRNEILKG